MNVLQLRDRIVELLSGTPSLIGTYTFPNGQKVPAVYVVGEKTVPLEWKADGLEVAIYEYPEDLPRPGVGIVDMLRQWEVILTQYTPGSQQLPEAINRMARMFPDAAFRRARGDDVTFPRCRIIIPDREIQTVLR
jgi:hypothetical protein